MSSDHDPEHCDVKGCPWCGPTDDCPFPHAATDDTDTNLDHLMRERPDGNQHRRLP